MMTDQQLVQSNFEEKIKIFTQMVDGEFKSDELFAVANTKLPTDTFNTLLIKSADTKDTSKVEQAIGYFSEEHLPYSVWMDVEYMNEKWKTILQKYDLKESEYNVMMKRENTVDVNEVTSNQLNITRVENNEDLLKYVDVFVSLFAGSTEVEALKVYFSKFLHLKLKPKVQMFVGCIDDKPVSTGLLIESKDSYGIYDVMTKEGYRSKGLGSEMFQFLLGQTTDKEKPVVLQASDDGKNIYKRHGFKEVGEMVVFE